LSKFAVLLEMIQLFTLSPQNLCIICKFVKIDHAEAWKMSYQQSSGAENDTTYGVFWTNLPNIYIIISSAAFLQRN